MKDCIFCKIISGEIPCYKIYEDDYTLAFLDISNDIYGHTLVIPKKHVKNILDCDLKTLNRVMKTIKKVSNHYIKDCGFDGVNIINANNESAEQSVFHLHFHIMPRKNNDGLKIYPKLEKLSIDLKDVQNNLKINN